MPIFEYRCGKCGHEFEELVFGQAAPACPKCKAPKAEKLMSCCRHKNAGGGADFGSMPSAPSSGGGCAGCSGGSCATCK